MLLNGISMALLGNKSLPPGQTYDQQVDEPLHGASSRQAGLARSTGDAGEIAYESRSARNLLDSELGGIQDIHSPGDESTRPMDDGKKKSSSTRVPVLSILLYTTLMAMASGLGAAPFLIFGRLSDYWAGMANAVAVGVMFTASYELLHEGGPYSPALTVLGMCIGGLFIKFSQDHLSKYEDCSFEDLQGADARKAILIVGVMAAHAFGEGSGVGVSFSGDRGWAQGMLVTIAIGLHNIPEGMAVAGVMMSRGSTPQKAVYWTLLCALPQAVVAVPSFLFVETFSALLPLALGFAAGCMIWIAFAELIPDALAAADHSHVATAATLSAAWLQGLSMFIESLEKPGGELSSPMQADPFSVAACVGVLLPALLVPCAVALVAHRFLPSAPVTLSASVGVLAFLSASDVLSLLFSGSSKAPVMTPLTTLALAGAGAAAVFIVWPSISSFGQEEAGVEAKHGINEPAGLTWGGHVEGMPLKHADHHEHKSHEANGDSWNSNFRMSPPSSNLHSMTDFVAVDLQQQQQQQASHMPTPHLIGNCQVQVRKTGAIEHNSIPCMNGNGHLSQPPCNPKSDLMGGAGSMKNQLLPAGLLCSGLLALQGVPLGMTLTKAVVAADSGGSSSHLLLPVALQGLSIGLACVGLSKSLPSASTWKPSFIMAALMAMVTASATACCLATTPLGMANSGSISFDDAGWTLYTRAVMSGATLTAALLFFWPAVRTYKARRAQAGVFLGLLAAAVPWALQNLLCWSTPYCIAA
eukprot:gene18562-25071_t